MIVGEGIARVVVVVVIALAAAAVHNNTVAIYSFVHCVEHGESVVEQPTLV